MSNGRLRTVLKWPVPVDDQEHLVGGGPVAHTAVQINPTVVMVWTVELSDEDPDQRVMRTVQVYGTGQPVPPEASHLGSCLAMSNALVWHVFSHSAADWDRY